MSGKLLQKFIVNAWAITKQSHLTWVKLNQAKLRVYYHQGIADAIANDPTVDTANLGQQIILPSLFLTAIANPNWPEIKKNLLPGQTSSD